MFFGVIVTTWMIKIEYVISVLFVCSFHAIFIVYGFIARTLRGHQGTELTLQ